MTIEKIEKVTKTFFCYIIENDEQEYLIESDKKLSTEEIKEKLEEGSYEL